MSYLDRHRGALGAAEWGWDQYEALAVQAAQAASGTFILSLVGRNGGFTRVTAYPTLAALGAAWDRTSAAFPAEVGFGIMFDKSRPPDQQIVEQGVNPAIETVVKKRIAWRTLAPWGVAGVAVLLAASYLNRRRPSRAGKTMKMRRRTPLWRKRVVTVWR